MYTVYIAGPMRGLPQSNFPAFDRAATILRENEFEVYSPAEHDRQMGYDGERWFDGSDTVSYEDQCEMISWDLATIIWACDAIVLLPGWEKSKGAAVEKALADFLGIDVLYFKDPDECPSDWLTAERAVSASA